MFRIPRGEKDERKSHADKYSPVADGFVGSELSVPPKQKRLQRLRKGGPALPGSLHVVCGELPAPEFFKKAIPGILPKPSMDEVLELNEFQGTPEGDLPECDVAFPDFTSSNGRIRTDHHYGRRTRLLEHSQSQEKNGFAERCCIGQQNHPSFPDSCSRRRSMTPRTANQLAKVIAPARAFTDDEQDKEEGEVDEDEDEDEEAMEEYSESESRASEHGNEQRDGATSEVGSSSDWTADDGTHLVDTGSPLMKRVQVCSNIDLLDCVDGSTGNVSPDALSASETTSDRICSRHGTHGSERAATQHRTSLLSSEVQSRNDLGGRMDRLRLPGQPARMKSLGRWMEVQEEILFTPDVKRHKLGGSERKGEVQRLAASSEGLGPSIPIAARHRLAAAATETASANASQRTGHARACDSGDLSRRYSVFAKGSVLHRAPIGALVEQLLFDPFSRSQP
ncbi:hypothetical protein MPH_09410 [Macrophomina phaseolina MS6]|uniref:Uncharacterized protein n=1 Tax=Macrophomina phaseolina (strain MS6) TaxID=1126212 RepID=K2RT34_MACPH|nr:hypothetical protein MPH_09410 [Macrophomina phaseolina MS6]